jgi:D-glycero-D-manno-heptose 1,7-bisphosphate phosphatase
MSGRRAVFLDRDGVLIRDVHHLTAASQIEILTGVPEALRRLRQNGWTVVVVTNQSVVARGLVTEEELEEIHQVLQERLHARGGPVDAIYYCPHHPQGAVARYRMACDCRKPRPGLLFRAAEDLGIDLAASIMVGDTGTDIEAGRRAGCRTVLIGTPDSAASPHPAAEGDAVGTDRRTPPDYVTSNLQKLAEWIVPVETT